MSNKIQVFELSNASNVSLGETGFKKGDDTAKYVCKITDATIVFKKGDDTAKYVCKITDATIVFVGDNSKFNTDKKKQFNTLSITLPKEQSEEFKRILDETKKESQSYSEYDGEVSSSK